MDVISTLHSRVSYAQHHFLYCLLGLLSASCQCLAHSELSVGELDLAINRKRTLTDRHFSYCSNIGLHSSVVAIPLRNSLNRVSDGHVVGHSVLTFAVPFEEAIIVASTPGLVPGFSGISYRALAHSLTSLHSGANDADIVLYFPRVEVQVGATG